jgi:hypothetical protein
MRQLLDPLLGARIEDGWGGVGAVGFELAWHHSYDYFATTSVIRITGRCNHTHA